MSSSLYLEIHSFAKVWARTLTPEVKRVLSAELCLFVRRASKPPSGADVIIAPLAGEGPWTTAAARQMDSLYGFWITEKEGHLCIAFSHKGVTDIVIQLSTPIILYYRDRPRVEHKVYGAFLLCLDLALGAKGLLFGHGAAVERDGRCILIAGHRGSNKTQILMTLLREGWNYVSDDKFILDKGTVHMVQPFIYVNDWHFDVFPWLKNAMAEGAGVAGWLALRQAARSVAQRHLHKRLLPLTDRLLNPSVKLDVATVFPSNKVLLSAQMSDLVLLKSGSSFICSAISREEAVRDMALVQRLASIDFAGLEPMLTLYGWKPGPDKNDLVLRNLGEQHFFRVSIPDRLEPLKMTEGILSCLERAS